MECQNREQTVSAQNKKWQKLAAAAAASPHSEETWRRAAVTPRQTADTKQPLLINRARVKAEAKTSRLS